MILDSIKVHAFRGIKNELPLDLRARLTLIHAPNGVGKTSLCDAVEWLFTGEVERLREPLGKSKGKGVNNIFTTVLPSVESEITNGGGPMRVRRSNTARANQIEVFKGGKWKKEALNTLLGNITPENLPQSSKGLQRLNSRRSWFRAVRLLEAHALDLLLDTNEPGNEVRDLVFCDLLGVGELQRQERDLLKIVGAIGGKSRLREELLRIKREIDSRESEITREALLASAPMLETYQQQIGAVGRTLGVKSLARAGPPETHLAAAENACVLAERRLAEQTSALAYVLRSIDSYKTLGEEIIALGGHQESLDGRRSEAQEQLQIALASFQKLENEASQAEVLAQSLMSQPLDSVKANLERVLAQWRDLSKAANTPIDLAGVQSRLAALRQTYSRADQFLNTVVKCQDSLKLWREAKLSEEAAIEKLRNLKSPSSEERGTVESEVSKARTALNTIETRFARLAGPLEELRIAGRDFLKEAKEEQRCPLCAHDHQSAGNLRAALESGLSTVPSAINELAAQKRTLESNIAGFEQQLHLWSQATRLLEGQTRELEGARRVLKDASPALETIGLHLEELRNEGLADRLVELRSKAESDAQQAERLASDQAALFKIGLELQSIAHEVRSMSENLQALAAITRITDLESLPPSDWPQTFDRLIRESESAAKAARGQAATSKKRVEESRPRLSVLQRDIATLTASIAEASEKIKKAKAEREEFEGQWRTVAGDQPWKYELLDHHQKRLEKTAENIARARQEIESARVALTAARSAESRERERASGQRQLVELETRLREVEMIAEIREDCVKGAEELRAAKDAFVKEQIQPLCDVITALYVRAQSAAFIDRIDSSQDEGPLRWLACIGQHQLENTAQMSLGQRQDLALAIFLSRARELGGTFFLDEPLLNLDDLNRIAVLDVLRTIVIEERSHPVRLVVTTANQSLVRHCKEKFALIKGGDATPSLRIYRLLGDPQSGVSAVLDN
jgi:exonuclease SbcC